MSENVLRRAPDNDAPRDTDPNVLQRRAANPDMSVWVGASAGSGKTKVLTDRIIRLMLPRDDGRPGSDPGAILALTFTKAGANEMAQRLNKRLAAWAVMKDDALESDMKDLFGAAPTGAQLTAARQLFARVVDAPGGMRIMTIHSFCGSILGRFPLEAGLPPHFTALEDGQDTILLDRARDAVLARAAREPGSALGIALNTIAAMQSEDQFAGLLKSLAGERRQLARILKDNFGTDGVYAELCRALNLPVGATREGLIDASAADENALRRAVKALAESGSGEDSKRAQTIQAWLDAGPARAAAHDTYRTAFLTNDGDVRKRLATKDAVTAMPDIADVLGAEAARLLALDDSIRAADTAMATRDLLRLGEAILDEYATLKDARAALDFDDLIIRTLALLQGQTMNMTQKDVAPWVRYKLDQGIDHILIDEAQDTNPEQWDIVRALTEEFFAGSGGRADENRTLFVVGDEKQSIFSFQRAAPDRMSAMQDWYAQQVAATGRTLEDVPLNTSFRSAPAILRAVDATFEPPDMRKGLGRNVREHIAHRRKQPGTVELWPVCFNESDDDADNDDGWNLPVALREKQSGAARLCAQIAGTIDGWIQTKEPLPARGRAVQAGDILILVRRRTPFVGQLVRALKNAGIPVSGVDRMVLKDQLAVEDLVCAASFALLPDDDLALAELLTSPFVGWDSHALYNIAQPRGTGESLWAALRKNDGPLVEWLSALIRRGAFDHPYEFFSRLLQEPCPADTVSGLRAVRGRLGSDALDPIDEFLGRALNYEDSALPTLQGFVHWHAGEASDIKRQMEEESGAVRIMTVHASKGLQAPIVILPDTTRAPGANNADRILWPDRSGFKLPVFVPTKDDVPAALQPARDTVAEKQAEEYLRLLYVAMTRAEDRLYVGGYKGNKPKKEKDADAAPTWHDAVAAGLLRVAETEKIPDGDDVILRLTNRPDRIEADRKGKDRAAKTTVSAPPAWLHASAPPEPTPPRPLVPSRPSGPLPPAASPRAVKDAYRFRRGTLTHTLLQYLPDIPADARDHAAQQFIERAGRDLPADVRGGIVAETMAVLAHPDFAAIFGPGSRAEISVTGLLDDATLISGQIDRLLVTENEILIIDYKTNRPPPIRVEDVPDMYVRQMRAYARAMEKIYPGRTVKCALLWTDGARLMEIAV